MSVRTLLDLLFIIFFNNIALKYFAERTLLSLKAKYKRLHFLPVQRLFLCVWHIFSQIWLSLTFNDQAYSDIMSNEKIKLFGIKSQYLQGHLLLDLYLRSTGTYTNQEQENIELKKMKEKLEPRNFFLKSFGAVFDFFPQIKNLVKNIW